MLGGSKPNQQLVDVLPLAAVLAADRLVALAFKIAQGVQAKPPLAGLVVQSARAGNCYRFSEI
jgi:hypothetical protein